MGYPTLTKLQAKEKGMRTELLMESGEKLSIYTLNPTGQKILGFTLPDIYEHLGSDVVENIEVNLL